MINNKLSSEKIILAIVILVALGIIAYFIMLKNPSPVAVQPTASPTITPIITSAPEPTLTPTPEPAIIPTPTPNIDISNWKTYRNEDYGYSVEYPSTWLIKTRENYQVHFLAPEGSRISGDSWLGEGNIFITMNELQNNQNLNPPSQYSLMSAIIIDGINAIRYDGVKGGQYLTNPSFIYTIVDLAKNNKELNLIFSDQISDRNDEKYIIIYNKMLSSFKFIK